MFLILAGILFLAFVSNVALGATGAGVVLSDVGEMLVLFAASVAFTVAILKREAEAGKNKKTHES